MTGHLTELARPQAEAKAQAYTQQVLRDHIQDQAGFDNRLDRCIALTESLLAETRNFLGEPEKEKLPAQLLSPVEYTETHASAGLKLARLTVEAAMADTQRVYESVDRLLTLREARRTALLPTSPPIHFPRLDAGSFGESAIATGNKSTDAGGEEELEFASAGATGGMYAMILALARDADGFF